MTFRHAAALALVGWYLMIAPPGPLGAKPPSLDYTEAYHWEIYRSYDRAVTCERDRRKMLAALRKAIEREVAIEREIKDPHRSIAPGHAHSRHPETSVSPSRIQHFPPMCIATDDRRLAN